MVAEIRNPTGNTGKGEGETVPENRRERNMGTLRDLVADKVFNLVGETEITAEAEVCEGEMVTTQTPQPGQTKNAGMWSELSGWR